jgi:hypothetical protein
MMNGCPQCWRELPQKPPLRTMAFDEREHAYPIFVDVGSGSPINARQKIFKQPQIDAKRPPALTSG